MGEGRFHAGALDDKAGGHKGSQKPCWGERAPPDVPQKLVSHRPILWLSWHRCNVEKTQLVDGR